MNLVDRFIHKYSRLPTEIDPDYLEMLRMSKYRILAVPDVSPGKCANCGASKNDGRRYVDFGLHVEFYGAVMLCGECLKDIARTMGLFEDLEDQLKASLEQTQRAVDLQKSGEILLHKMLQVNKEFENFVNLHSLGNDSSINSSASVGSNETASKSTIDETKSRVTKSNPVSGRKDVPRLADLLNDPRS